MTSPESPEPGRIAYEAMYPKVSQVILWADLPPEKQEHWARVEATVLASAARWEPIATAPKKRLFWAWRRGALVQVQRFDVPDRPNAVIDPETGVWWQPPYWMPILPLPAPPPTEKEASRG